MAALFASPRVTRPPRDRGRALRAHDRPARGSGQGGAAVRVTFEPFDLARITRESLDLPASPVPAFAGWCALWLFASLGLRWLGVRPALAAISSGPRAGAALAAMALSAWPLGLAFRIAVADALPGQKVVNDAAYIVEQGGPLLWVFTALGPGAASPSDAAASHAWPSLLLAVPSTLQFVVRKSTAAARSLCRRRWCARWRPFGRGPDPATSSSSAPAHATRPRPCCSPTCACPTSGTRPSAPSSPRKRPWSAGTSRCSTSSGPRTRPRPEVSRATLRASWLVSLWIRPRALPDRGIPRDRLRGGRRAGLPAGPEHSPRRHEGHKEQSSVTLRH